ncbi:hypothetical protein BDZ89DRAFT_1045099 [Hymenopellis radicata]|nr:hypothetical protein BDZ89DRAFT_1045099 [Hymenopellis radicata]
MYSVVTKFNVDQVLSALIEREFQCLSTVALKSWIIKNPIEPSTIFADTSHLFAPQTRPTAKQGEPSTSNTIPSSNVAGLPTASPAQAPSSSSVPVNNLAKPVKKPKTAESIEKNAWISRNPTGSEQEWKAYRKHIPGVESEADGRIELGFTADFQP